MGEKPQRTQKAQKRFVLVLVLDGLGAGERGSTR
jgi:hypothetical protein